MLRQIWGCAGSSAKRLGGESGSAQRSGRAVGLIEAANTGEWGATGVSGKVNRQTEAGAFIVLFRGVGGATTLPTAPLRQALATAGFENVRTYIASGNAVLTSHLGEADVQARVAAVARSGFGFTKEIMVVPQREWADMIGCNPFPEAAELPKTLHLFTLARMPAAGAFDALVARAAPGERLASAGRFLYLHVPLGFSASKLPPVVDRVLKTPTTARNWNTVLKLADLAQPRAENEA